MEMSEHTVFKIAEIPALGETKNVIVKKGFYPSGALKLDICDIRGNSLIEASIDPLESGKTIHHYQIILAPVQGLFTFLEKHNIISREEEYVTINGELEEIVKVTNETDWVTDVENSVYVINHWHLFAKSPQDAFNLYLFALQADSQETLMNHVDI